MYRENHSIIPITYDVPQLCVVGGLDKTRFFGTVQRIGGVDQAVVVIVAIQVVADTVPIGIESIVRIVRGKHPPLAVISK